MRQRKPQIVSVIAVAAEHQQVMGEDAKICLKKIWGVSLDPYLSHAFGTQNRIISKQYEQFQPPPLVQTWSNPIL